VELCSELFHATCIIPTLFPCFLLICYPYILLHFENVFFFILDYYVFVTSSVVMISLLLHEPVRAITYTKFGLLGD